MVGGPRPSRTYLVLRQLVIVMIGLNLIGLRRRGFTRESIKELKNLYRSILSDGGRPRALAEEALKSGTETDRGREFLEFLAVETNRGIARPRRGGD